MYIPDMISGIYFWILIIKTQFFWLILPIVQTHQKFQINKSERFCFSVTTLSAMGKMDKNRVTNGENV